MKVNFIVYKIDKYEVIRKQYPYEVFIKEEFQV